MTYRHPEEAPVGAEVSTDPKAAHELCELMGEISEELWCAGWLIKCEFTLWSMVLGGDRQWSVGDVDITDVMRLRDLSERCGGWIVWAEDAGETWVPMTEWLRMYEVAR